MSILTVPYIPTDIEITADLKNFYHYLEHEIKPQADRIDSDTKSLLAAFNAMAIYKIFGVDVPKESDGLELNITQRHYYMRNMVRTSAALNLLQMQHQAGLRILAASNSGALKQKYLSVALSGKHFIGIAIAHLRNSINNPQVRGIKCEQGYCVNGTLRFVTGHGIFQQLIVGFFNEHEEEILALMPFPKKNTIKNTFILSAPMDLPACKSTRTIWIELKNFIVPHHLILSIKPKYTFYNRSITRHNFESIQAGAALAVLDLIAQSPRITEQLIKDFYQKLIGDMYHYEQDVIARTQDMPVAPIRARGIMLVNRCLLFAGQVFRGSGVNKKHPLYRLQNEAQLIAAMAADDHLLRELVLNINYAM